MVEVEDAAADEHRLEHTEILAADMGIAEGLADARHAGIRLDLDQPALPAMAATPRHAVRLLRREGVFETDESEAFDGRHDVSPPIVIHKRVFYKHAFLFHKTSVIPTGASRSEA